MLLPVCTLQRHLPLDNTAGGPI